MHATAKRAVAALLIAFLSVSGWYPSAAQPRIEPQQKRLIQPRPILPELAARLQGSDFRLDFKDAYLVYEPPAGGGGGKGTLQIAAELNVLSYGNDWDVAQLKPFLFHLRLNSWSGFYWKVNTSRREIYKVTGGTFGALGGTETAITDITVDPVGDINAPERFMLRFANSYLIKPTSSAHPQIIASGMVLSYGADWTITQDSSSPWVYHLSESVWKGFSWKANLRRLRAYRVTDPLNPCGSDVLLKADVVAPASIAGGPNDYDVFGCTWAAVARAPGEPYPPTNPLAADPDEEVVGKDVAIATYPMAMTRISALDAATEAVLASPPVGAPLADFDLRFANSAATRNVVFEISRLDTGEVIHRSAAVSLSKGDNPRHILVSAEGAGISGIPFPGAANTGLFTRVGFVELADIDTKGFAKFAGSAAQWRDAPFGGGLKLFGAFTQNFYPPTGPGAYCYKIKLTPPSGPASYLADPLYKTRYVVKSDGHVQSQSVFLGPLTLGSVNGCYRLTPLSSSPEPSDPAGAIAVFWSFPDLLGNWATGSRNALHTARLELYTAATGALYPLINNDNMTAELYLDNTPIDMSFDQLVAAGGGAATSDLLVDKCAIVSLMNGRTLTVDFTAAHPTGFMSAYALTARSNSGINVWSEDGAYGAPAWGGSRPPAFVGRAASAPAFVKTAADFSAGPCAYVLDLSAWARTTDGYSRINHRHQQLFYYIQP